MEELIHLEREVSSQKGLTEENLFDATEQHIDEFSKFTKE